VLKNRVLQAIEDAIATLAIEQPAFGQACVANELTQHGLTVSPPARRAIIMEHHGALFDPSITW
jgi:hypothetical protein